MFWFTLVIWAVIVYAIVIAGIGIWESLRSADDSEDDDQGPRICGGCA